MQQHLIVQSLTPLGKVSPSGLDHGRELHFPDLDTVILEVNIPADLFNAPAQLYNVYLRRDDWLLVDLTPVRIASKRSGVSFLGALEMVASARFCLIATPRSRWITHLLPDLAAPVTFKSMGDAVQMMVLENHGFGSEWRHARAREQQTIEPSNGSRGQIPAANRMGPVGVGEPSSCSTVTPTCEPPAAMSITRRMSPLLASSKSRKG